MLMWIIFRFPARVPPLIWTLHSEKRRYNKCNRCQVPRLWVPQLTCSQEWGLQWHMGASGNIQVNCQNHFWAFIRQRRENCLSSKKLFARGKRLEARSCTRSATLFLISLLLFLTWSRLGRVLAYGFPLTEFGGFHGPSSANSKLFHGSEFQLVKDRGNNKNSSSIV